MTWWRMDGLQKKADELARQNARLIEALEVLKDWQRSDAVQGLREYDQGLMCGVEDRGFQNDGYAAMRYGYDAALQRVAEEIDGTIETALKEEPPKS